jgi:hypothetical protein
MFCRNKRTISVAAAVVCIMAAGAAGQGAGQKGAGSPKDAKAAEAAAPTPGKLKAYPSRYYVIYTDLGADVVAEASARMTAMAEEYHNRTKDFAGVIRSRLPFYLYSRSEDYLAAGGLPGSAGQFSGGQQGVLMALAGSQPSLSLWHTVQHEGFHQFVHMVIGGQIPVWVDEGLAEYFGLGIWTGDGFVTGTIPQGRLVAVRGCIKEDRITPLADFLMISGDEWRDAFSRKQTEKDKSKDGPKGQEGKSDSDRVRINYDQAWSIVHFLVHAENGKYRGSFSGLIADVSAGMDWRDSFRSRFGGNVKAFEQKYRQWWLALPDNPTRDVFIKADVATLTSFLARAASQGQSFTDAKQFFQAAKAGNLKCNPAQKLPASLLDRTLVSIRGWDRGWSIDNTARVPKLVLAWPDGTTFTGAFTIGGGKCANVKLTVTPPPPAVKDATTKPAATTAPKKLAASGE